MGKGVEKSELLWCVIMGVSLLCAQWREGRGCGKVRNSNHFGVLICPYYHSLPCIRAYVKRRLKKRREHVVPSVLLCCFEKLRKCSAGCFIHSVLIASGSAMTQKSEDGVYDCVGNRAISLLEAHDLETWKTFTGQLLKENISAADWRDVIARTSLFLRGEGKGTTEYFGFAANVGVVLLEAGVQSGNLSGTDLFDFRELVAGLCVRGSNEEQAQNLWGAMLPAKDSVTSLVIVTRILKSVLRRGNYAVADAKYLQGVALYRTLLMQPEASDVVNDFLHSLGLIMLMRHRFADASQRFHDLYLRTKNLSHLRLAVVSTIQMDASATRSQRLSVLQKDQNAGMLGDLYYVLTRASHCRMLLPSDLERFTPFMEPSEEATGLLAKHAFLQHNLQTISRAYSNIGFLELGTLLGVQKRDAERLVAQMVSERRLGATIDQVAEMVTFSEASGATTVDDIDVKIGLMCEHLSQASQLVIASHPEFNEYVLQR
ncbi:putative cop9 signalosome complex subunit [Trypanosoma vivax]|nr:putative cop9 signalosome complex subunit [Trypanosoma vivax]